jgi:hypothetical protein
MAFMTHPKHGATITSAVAEHEENGWTVGTPEEWISGKNAGQDANESVSDDPVAEAPKERGRPAGVR